MCKIEFGKIDKLHDPQCLISATFDSEHVTFAKLEKRVDEPEIIARTECIRDLLKWVDDESATKVYGFDCKKDNLANVFNVYLANRWVVLQFIDKKRVVDHEYLSIESLRKLVKKMEEKR